MSATLQANLTALLQDNYVSLAVIVAVAYDYLLTFPNEIEYIWNRRWSWVSFLFVLIRYCGLYNVTYFCLRVRHFLLFSWSDLLNRIETHYNSCEIAFLISAITFVLYLAAADLLMMLRVWAMYDRSRKILVTLVVLFSLEMISLVLSAVVDSIPKNTSVSVDKILDFSFCELKFNVPLWMEVATAFQVTHGTVMCILAVIQSVRQSLQMYRWTKQWQLDRYMKLLVKEGILYFVAFVLFNLVDILAVSGNLPEGGWRLILSMVVAGVPTYTLIPRFIMNMREMYARDVQRGEGIDTAFGLSSIGNEAETALMFRGVEEELEEMDSATPMDSMTV